MTTLPTNLYHKKSLILLSLGLVILTTGWLVARWYLKLGAPMLQPGQPVFVNEAGNEQRAVETATPNVTYRVESVAQELRVPWSVVFTSPSRALITERPGRVRVLENGQLNPEPLRVFPEVSTTAEEGLMGMTLDPAYAENKYLYLCIAYEKAGQTVDKVVRFTDTGSALSEDYIVMDDIPAARFHAGCRLKFGPDGKLYISTGDATRKESAQELDSLAGKILRLNSDGSIPADNPFPNSAIYSYGHRNPQGFDWHPVSQTLVATEHGPSGNDGPGGGDEVNIITAGGNYGWPVVSHEKSQAGMIDPAVIFTPAVAPASGMFYRGSVYPQLTNTFLFGALRGEGIIQVVFDQNNPSRVLSYQKLAGIEVGRVRDIVEGPDGLIYFTTSNQDGRGSAQVGDDQLYRLVPELTSMPFKELTIPFLRSRSYQSSLGELTPLADNGSYRSFLTSYDSDGLRINALLTQPAGQPPAGGWPAIVFIHGYIPPSQYRTQEKYVEYVNGLARSGFVVLKIDLRGHGSSEGEASGAYYSSDYIVDTLNAYRALQSSSFVHPQKIGLWGHSMAGNVIIRTVVVEPSIPAAVVWGGAVFGYQDFRDLGISDGSYQPPSNASERQRRRQQLFDTYGQFELGHYFWSQVDATPFLSELRGAFQFHHAVNDSVVDVQYSRNIHDRLTKAGVTSDLYEYQTGGHNITSPSFGPAMERTVTFFQTQL